MYGIANAEIKSTLVVLDLHVLEFFFFSFAGVIYTWRAAALGVKCVVFCGTSTGPCFSWRREREREMRERERQRQRQRQRENAFI